jgi:uncharacterized repeat protein (TIGR01451 family)/LPXTG-motif cell wall-anchored protein
MFNLSSTIDRKNRRVLAAFVAALVALALLVVAPGSVPDADADTNHTFEYVLVFQNGQTLTSPPGGTTDGDQNSVWVPNSGGTDPDNPGAGMLVHMSCSDNFNLDLDPGDASYGYSDAGFEPSNPEDSAWRVADYAFRRVGTNGGQCGNQDLFDHPTLTLVKTVEGGPLSDSDFPAFIDGDAADWGVAYTLNPGDYTASETTQDNYTAGDWGGDCATDGTVTIEAGDDLTCTVTNTYVPTPNPSINIEKATNGEDADTPTGPVISVGDTVTWTYVVTNTGDVDLTNVNVSDDQGVTPVLKSGDVGNDGILSVNEIWIYEATGLAVLGQYENLGSVTADHGQDEVSDDDPSHYFGQQVLASATLGDTVWYDCATDDSDDPGCNNGVQDAGEPVIEGAKVTLTGLDGQDVDPDTGGVQTTLTQLTNASGKYLFSGLPEGNYKVQVNINDVPDPSGLDRSLGFTTPSSFTLFLPDAGEDLTSDFGVIADTLPETGTSADVLVPIAAMLLLAGTFAVLASRRWEDGAVTDSRS